MLRWKNHAAFCAFIIALCPLNSFAQQTGTINRTLQPLASTPDGVASPDVVIRTPYVQPENPNLYLFVVENVGSVDATVASIDLYVPQGVAITNVVPAPSHGDAQWAHVRLANLAAGSKSIIEVETSPTSRAFEFKTRLALEAVQKLTAARVPNYNVRSIANPAAPPTKVVAAMLQEAVTDSQYLIPATQASHTRTPSPSQRLAAAKNAIAAQAQAAKLAASAAQAAADAKLLKTVKALRSAGQDALADAYLAAAARSETCHAETF